MGFCFDFYRILRWRFRISKILTFIGDLLFSLFSLLILFYFAQKANYLELRFYLFGGILIGLLLYLRLLSNSSKKLFTIVITLTARLITMIAGIILQVVKGFCKLLALIMSIPYGFLSWFSILIYRIGEALGKNMAGKIRERMDKSPGH